ncbi:autotransporter [Bacillus mycoides]|uniref:autotransporter n=1 Tax=Bacillus mycoides TaxID=1405 RepID=UPI001A345E5B|nr:autotransporter [Bacillus mycoides]MBJ7995217.1 autotransporter [Bacillus cereus]QWH83104.1 autotransporter [Bacillus mycoides]QWI95100.1 autotransporter [Bacillus mycoides]UNJ95482.1 autotransporter [Bacillus mycoides]
MKKYISIITMLILLVGFFPLSVTYAKENNITLSNIEKMTNVFNNDTSLVEKISAIRNDDWNNWSVKEINQILDKIDDLNLSIMERASLKREIIRFSGFSNFDFKGTNSDVLAFKELKIEIIETENPLILHRRSKSGEPESKYGLGYWWGDKERNIEETRNELAVLEAWGNPLNTQYEIKVPKGTRILKGLTASQTQYLKGTSIIQEYREGGAIQYWINKIDNSWLQ